MTFEEALARLRQGMVKETDDRIAFALAEQIEANRKAIEELRAELDKDSTFQPFGSEPWLY